MDRRLAPVLGLLLVASFYSFVSGPSSGSGSPSSGETVKKQGKATGVSSKGGNAPVEMGSNVKLISRSELGPWQAACSFFIDQRDHSPAIPLDLLRPSPKQIQQAEVPPFVDTASGTDPNTSRWCLPKEPTRLGFMIVTVPDPVNTHLSLYFDSRIEAVQWAAMDSGYIGDRYWLPWDAAAPSQFDDPEQQRSEAILRGIRAGQPGLQIFRCIADSTCAKSKAVFVFFVAETPTFGINKGQLLNALAYVQQLGGKPTLDSIDVLGPSFSGSVPSLKEILLASDKAKTFHVITSSATNEGALLSMSQAQANAPGIVFQTVAHTDRFALQYFFASYVQADLKLRSCDVALLSESETAYGSGLAQKSTGTQNTDGDTADCSEDISDANILHIRFPRDISHLRLAYPDQPVPQQANPQMPNPTPGLTFDLKQVLGGEDDLPTFSMSQLPLAQESVLLDIAAVLRQRKIKLVGIGATDPFDTLFVARFLKQFAPDVRLFVLNSDVLLIRAAESFPLVGTLAITTYPLISANQRWTYPVSTGDPDCAAASLHLQFPSFFSEGTYNAFLALRGHASCMRDYAWPDGRAATRQPPLWLTVVGHDGYGPIKILAPEDEQHAEQVSFVEMKAPAPGFRHQAPGGAYLFLCAIMIILSLAHAILGKVGAPSGLLRGFHELFDVQIVRTQQAQRAFFLVTAQLILLTADVVIFLPVWYTPRSAGEWFHWFVFFPSVLATVLTLIAFVLSLILCLRMPRAQEPWFNNPHILTWFSVLWSGAFTLCWLSLMWQAQPGSLAGSLFLLRSTDLASGISPLLPSLLLAIALYIWCWTQTRRVRLWEWRHPILPTAALDEAYGCKFAQHQSELDGTLRPVMPASHAVKIVFLVVLTSPIVLRPWRHIAGLETSSSFNFAISTFDFLYLLQLILVYALIFAAWMRVLSVWSSIRAILSGLERPLLRRAFGRLPKENSMSLLLNANSRNNYIRIRRSLECLQKLTRDPGAVHLPELAFYRDKLKASLQDPPSQTSVDRGILPLRIHQLQQNLCDTSDYLLRQLLIPYWSDTGAAASLKTSSDAGVPAAPASNERYVIQGEEPHEPPDHIVMAEEFVARRFVGLIRYGFLQMGNLLFFLIVAFVLSVASLRSYPFLAHRTIGWSLVFIALILGAGIVAVFAQMERDPILSRLSNTEPGKLGRDFYVRVLSYGALPLLTVLASQFPSFGKFLFSWVQPGLEAMK